MFFVLLVTGGISSIIIAGVDALFIEEGKYYRVRFTAPRTYALVISLLDEVEEMARKTGVYRFLFDFRESEEGFSVTDKYELGVYLGRLFGAQYTVAALLRREHITGFLENVSANQGAKSFIITDSEEKAVSWVRETVPAA